MVKRQRQAANEYLFFMCSLLFAHAPLPPSSTPLLLTTQAEDRILQLICVQTKPVQIYRITAGEALPPRGMALHAHDDYVDRDGDIKIDTSFSSTSTSETANAAANVNAPAAEMEGAEASAAAAAVAMAAAERIFGDDEEDIEDSSGSKERGGSCGGVSVKGGLGTPPKREKVSVRVVFPEEAGGGMKGGLGDGLCKGLRWYNFLSCLVCMVARVACLSGWCRGRICCSAGRRDSLRVACACRTILLTCRKQYRGAVQWITKW